MIQLLVLIVEPETERVRSLQPRKIRNGQILVVTKQKRVSSVGVSEIGPARDLERGSAALQTVRPIRSRNLENLEAKV